MVTSTLWKVEAGESVVHGHPYSKLKSSLSFMRSCLKKEKKRSCFMWSFLTKLGSLNRKFQWTLCTWVHSYGQGWLPGVIVCFREHFPTKQNLDCFFLTDARPIPHNSTTPVNFSFGCGSHKQDQYQHHYFHYFSPFPLTTPIKSQLKSKLFKMET